MEGAKHCLELDAPSLPTVADMLLILLRQSVIKIKLLVITVIYPQSL